MRKLIAMIMLMAGVAYGAGYQTYRQSKCAWCGTSKTRLVVHHIVPQHIKPELRDEPSNLVTLCDPYLLRKTGCHYKLGHRGQSWTNDNSKLMILICDHLKKENNEKVDRIDSRMVEAY